MSCEICMYQIELHNENIVIIAVFYFDRIYGLIPINLTLFCQKVAQVEIKLYRYSQI